MAASELDQVDGTKPFAIRYSTICRLLVIPGVLVQALVRETKSTTVAADLRGTENDKIRCGERHFVGG